MANTLDTSCNQGVAIEVNGEVVAEEHSGRYVEISPGVVVYAVWSERFGEWVAIRKLTPKECFRLQGWSDDYFDKAEFVNSDSQLYKQAGNGVTVTVVKAVGKAINEAKEDK